MQRASFILFYVFPVDEILPPMTLSLQYVSVQMIEFCPWV